jgi:4-hydroxy-4-methyl-2-oxoglutarate aldolase
VQQTLSPRRLESIRRLGTCAVSNAIESFEVRLRNDPKPGFGAYVGEIHAAMQRALGCVGAVTNGALRDLQAVEAADYQLFAGNVAVSQAYDHMVAFGAPAEAGGLRAAPGDLIFGDSHGVLTVPREIASQIPAQAEAIALREPKVIDLCKSRRFSLEALREVIRELD